MNWLDIVLVVVIGLATFIGLRKGIIKMALTLAGLVLGIFLAGRYYMPFSEHLTLISSPTWAKVAAFAIIFIGVMVVAAILARLLEKAASVIMLGWANRLVGAILGFVVGAMFCGAVLAIWVKYLGVSGAIADSNIAPILLDRFPKVLALLPDDFDAIRSFFD
ncbi:MAG TPA: CvpA family protein [Dehalococcoidia bacterium]|nr:CvpA family protein [Dehalococcoidia bacterium]